MGQTTPSLIRTVQDYHQRLSGCYNVAEPPMPTQDAPRNQLATVSVKDAARLLGISPEKVREGVRNGTIPGYVYGERPNYKVYRIPLLQMVGFPLDYEFPD